MKTINSNGFSAVELIIIMVVVVVLGLAGYFVYKHEHMKNVGTLDTSNNTSASSLKTYRDKLTGVSFRYPSTWSVSRNTDVGNGGYIDSACSPASTQQYYDSTDRNASGQQASLCVSFDASVPSPFSGNYTAVSAQSLTISGNQKAQLIGVNMGSGSFAYTKFIVVDGMAKTGDQINLSDSNSIINLGKKIVIYARAVKDGSGSSIEISDLPAFEQSRDYQNMLTVINSVYVQ